MIGLRLVRPNSQWVWFLRQEGIKIGWSFCLFHYVIIPFEIKRNLFFPAPIVRENSERGGALHNLRRSIHLQQNVKWTRVCYKIKSKRYVWMINIYINLSCLCLVLMENIENLTSWDCTGSNHSLQVCFNEVKFWKVINITKVEGLEGLIWQLFLRTILKNSFWKLFSDVL